MVQLGRLTGNLRTKLSSKNAINHRIAQAPPRRFPRRLTIHYFRRSKRSTISVCGPTVDQLRQDFWAAGACKCDTRFRFSDTPVRDQGVGGSNPLAPTISPYKTGFFVGRKSSVPLGFTLVLPSALISVKKGAQRRFGEELGRRSSKARTG
jgi:hypothetical protein